MTQNRGKMSPDDGQTLCMNGMHTNYYYELVCILARVCMLEKKIEVQVCILARVLCIL